MRTISLLTIFFFCFLWVPGQDSARLAKSNNADSAATPFIIKIDQKVFVIRGSDTLPVAVDLFLVDGSVVKKDGSIILKDGKMLILKPGEKVFFDDKAGIKKIPLTNQ